MTIIGVLWAMVLTIWSALQFYLMTVSAGPRGGLPPGIGLPILAYEVIAVATCFAISVLHGHLAAKAMAQASRVTAKIVSLPSAVIVVISWSFSDDRAGIIVPSLLLGAGAIAAWAVACACTVSASMRPHIAAPVAAAIALSPLLLVWLRLVSP